MADILKPDLCIIGAGAPGLAAALLARRHDASVVLIDTGIETGDSLNSGPLPTEALAAIAARAQTIRSAAAYGLTGSEPKPNFRAIQEQVEAALTAAAPQYTPERLRALGIVVLTGPAQFLDRRTLKVDDEMVRARRFVIATGSRPRVPAIKGLDQIRAFGLDTVHANAKKLTHLVVIGGTAAALELAQAYRRLGSEVTLVPQGPILPTIDAEILAIALKQLREEGVAIIEGGEVIEIVPRSQGTGVSVKGADGTLSALDASHVLVAAGREANLLDLGLDKAGVRHDPQAPGLLKLGRGLTTSNRRIAAIGPAAIVECSPLLARQQAEYAVAQALFGAGRTTRPAPDRELVLIDPAIAQIGMTEAVLRARRNGDFLVVRASFGENERAIVMRQGGGTAKLVTDRHGRILGASIAGPGAGEVLALLALAMAEGVNAAALADLAAPATSFAAIAVALGQAFDEQAPTDAGKARRLHFNRLWP